MTLLGTLDVNSIHSTSANDIWGYVDTAGNEYALVGTQDGVSIVDVTDPFNPTEVFWHAGMHSVWRDIKTWGKYAYVTTEADESLLIIDMSSLPLTAGIQTTYWSGVTPNIFESAHNLFIDSSGYCYLFGSNLGNGGVRILDLNPDPWNPVEVGFYEQWYVHDGVVYNDTMYLGHIYEGVLSVVDVTNKSNPQLLGTINSPGNFTHNVWTSTDRNYAFTTDEIGAGFIAAIDVSDPANMAEVDKIQSSPGQNAMPHNAHFINDYLVTSYYRDGVVVHDVSNPSNIIEVGNFDSSPLSGNGSEGCWGAYPWLPSGNVIISDRQTGLYVLNIDYKRGCYLLGQVTDQYTTFPIPNAEVEILGHNQLDFTNLSGNYESGIGVGGIYDVVYSKPSYFPDTIENVILDNGIITVQNVQLIPKTAINFVISVTEAGSGTPLEDANVHMFSHDFDHSVYTNAAGFASIFPFYEDSFDLAIGHWGHEPVCIPIAYYDTITDTIYIELEPGYYDDFSVDQGWQVSGNASTGMWVRDVPIGTQTQWEVVAPFKDMPWDCHKQAFITGNGGLVPDFDDVDYGYTLLTSPKMDLSGFTDPHVNYNRWFFTLWGPFPPDDSLYVYLEDESGVQYIIDTVFAHQLASEWRSQSIRVLDFVPSTSDSLTLNVYTSDFDTMVNVTEGGLDMFFVTNYNVIGIKEHKLSEIKIYPNPAGDVVFYELNQESARLELYDISGKLIITFPALRSGAIDLSGTESGLYILKALFEDGSTKIGRIIKE